MLLTGFINYPVILLTSFACVNIDIKEKYLDIKLRIKITGFIFLILMGSDR